MIDDEVPLAIPIVWDALPVRLDSCHDSPRIGGEIDLPSNIGGSSLSSSDINRTLKDRRVRNLCALFASYILDCFRRCVFLVFPSESRPSSPDPDASFLI